MARRLVMKLSGVPVFRDCGCVHTLVELDGKPWTVFTHRTCWRHG